MSVLLDVHRRVMRAPLNPLDKSTVVSIFPVALDETKPTITPSRFMIPPGSYEKPEILVVTSSSWWRELDQDQPLLEIPVSSIQVADSIVKDYCNGMFLSDMETCMPGLFFIPGEFDVLTIKTHKKAQLDAAQKKQNEYWRILVEAADTLWNRTQGNPLAVSDLMRLAASQLGMKTKPWMSNFVAQVALNNCPACGSLINMQFPICQVCKTVHDKKKFDELGFKFAE